MDCESREDQLLLYALGTLDGPELQELRAHLQTGCPRCEGRLNEAKAMLALLPLSLPAVKAPPQVRERLLERIANPASTRSTPTVKPSMRIMPAPPPRSRSVFWPLLIGGALAASFTAFICSSIISKQNAAISALSEKLARQQDELQQVASPTVKVADFKPMPAQPHAMARLFWDPQSRSIHLRASDLTMLPPDRVYELWLINDKKEPHAAGTFTVDANGIGSVTMTMPDNPGPIIATAVSEEQSNGGKGVMRPTMTAVQLQANVH